MPHHENTTYERCSDKQIRRSTRKFHRKNSIHEDVQRHFLWNKRQMKNNVWHMLKSYLCVQGSLVQDNGHSFSPGSEKKWHSLKEDSPQGICDNIAEKMLIEFAESGCPTFRATTPLSRGQLRSKGHGKLSIHFAATQETIETIFRIIVSATHLSLYLRSSRGNA